MEYQYITLQQDIVIDRLYTIHYQEITNDYVFKGESHAFWELLCIDKGEAIATADGRQFKLLKDEVVFHKPNEFHAVCSNGKIAPNLIIISFDCSSPAMDFFKEQVIKLTTDERFLLGQIILEAKRLFANPLNNPLTTHMERVINPPFGCEQMIKLFLEQFLIKLVRRNSPKIDLITNHYSDKTKQQYDNILEYIDNHLNTQLSLDQICRDNLISYSQLYHIFKERHNLSIMNFISDRKINMAKQMIREQKLNFSQIADFLGYSSIHYFSRQFKKQTGMTPSEYSQSAKMITDSVKKQ